MSAPVAIVTGGGSGIGAATAAALSDAGYRVMIVGRRRSALVEVAAATGALPHVADLSSPSESVEVVERLRRELGRLDCLVLNAGITREGPFGASTDEDLEAMLAVNCVSAARLVRLALPDLLSTRGSIVAVASVAALRMNRLMAGYSASKAALVALVQSIAVEHGPRGLRANAVCPGWVSTEMADAELGDIARERGITLEEAYRLATTFVPMERAAAPAEVASVIAFLASPAAGYVNGVALPVDGGACVSDAGALAL